MIGYKCILLLMHYASYHCNGLIFFFFLGRCNEFFLPTKISSKMVTFDLRKDKVGNK